MSPPRAQVPRHRSVESTKGEVVVLVVLIPRHHGITVTVMVFVRERAATASASSASQECGMMAFFPQAFRVLLSCPLHFLFLLSPTATTVNHTSPTGQEPSRFCRRRGASPIVSTGRPLHTCAAETQATSTNALTAGCALQLTQ